ncbi:MAG TPA: FAD-binding protein, partial [Dehalococcoidia bacterium]|nr:FAD-binding protein [Dehalococcoidia bacterium]
VFGWRGGASAAAYASGASSVPWPAEAAREEREHALRPLGRNSGPSGRELEAKVQKTMSDYVGVRRNEAGLRNGIQRLETLQNYVAELRAGDPQALMVAHEARNALRVGEMVARAALMRTESRWTHRRVDYPEPDDANWRKYLVVAGVEGRTVLYTRDLPV